MLTPLLLLLPAPCNLLHSIMSVDLILLILKMRPSLQTAPTATVAVDKTLVLVLQAASGESHEVVVAVANPWINAAAITPIGAVIIAVGSGQCVVPGAMADAFVIVDLPAVTL